VSDITKQEEAIEIPDIEIDRQIDRLNIDAHINHISTGDVIISLFKD
jgi:hypothetical protein